MHKGIHIVVRRFSRQFLAENFSVSLAFGFAFVLVGITSTASFAFAIALWHVSTIGQATGADHLAALLLYCISLVVKFRVTLKPAFNGLATHIVGMTI